MDILASESPFYRVSVKALILDDQQRLLVFQDKDGQWELPGGGWEHGESLEACVVRELQEEMRIVPLSIGPVSFIYAGVSDRGYHKLRIAVPVTTETTEFVPSADNLVAARYVNSRELRALAFAPSEAPVLEYIDKIWPATNS